MKAIIVNNGLMEIGEVSDPVIGADQIKIRVHAAGINRADVLQRKGLYPPPKGESDVIGLEVAGEVIELGENCEKYKVGDRVFALLAGGGYAEYAVIHESIAMPIPYHLDYVQAAGIAEVFLTAYQAMFQIGRLKSGETVLIHAGASGVGTAAIQLAKERGAKVIITAGSQRKTDFCEVLGADFCINYKYADFDQQVLEITDGRGVEMIIDFIGESYFPRNLNAIATDGRWIVLAFLGGVKAEGEFFSSLMKKRIQITGSTLRARSVEYKTQLVQEFTHDFLSLFANDHIKPIIDDVFELSQVNEAHEYMERNQNIGKLILKII
jgi:putative PIG3 family NAD(P)H quinone oxidoreductase